MTDDDTRPSHCESANTTALEADQALRVPCYCEENVWRLAYRRLKQQEQQQSQHHPYASEYYVIFISNERQCVPFFHQLAVEDSRKPCFWDYHVILFVTDLHGSTFVLDLDSRLPYGCRFEDYLAATFALDLPDNFAPLFR
jgi:hypothetical protein